MMFIWSTMLNPKTGSLEIKCDRCAGDDDTPQLQPEWEHQGAGAAYDGGGGGVCEAADHLDHLQTSIIFCGAWGRVVLDQKGLQDYFCK